MGRSAYGSSMCGPVFQAFMEKAIQKYGGTEFKVPEGCDFINIDRYSGSRLPDGASGANVVSECFREGEDPLFGIMFDGGYAMGGDFDLFQAGETEQVREVTTSTGNKAQVGQKSSFGNMSSGGLY